MLHLKIEWPALRQVRNETAVLLEIVFIKKIMVTFFGVGALTVRSRPKGKSGKEVLPSGNKESY